MIAQDGVEALAHLFNGNERAPALILLDLNLPKISGLEVLRRVREDRSLKDVPVVVLTSSNEESDRSRAQSLRVNLYLRKPIDFNDFDAVAQQIKDFLIVLPPAV